MIPVSRATTLLRFLFRLFRARAFRGFLFFLLGLWAFDRCIFLATQHSFFASVGLQSWFWRALRAPIELFSAFLLICLRLMRVFLHPLAPRAGLESGPQLRGALTRFETLRERIYPLARAICLVLALLLARDFARFGNDWIALKNAQPVGFAYLGLDASFWLHFLPVWMPLLGNLWKFCCVLGILTALTAVLRALPLLAAHNAFPPLSARVLWRASALVLGVRALLYAFQVLDLPRGVPLSSGAVFVLSPLWFLGALWCAFLGVRFWRRSWQKAAPFPTRARDKVATALFLGVAALFLPVLLGVLSFPLRAILPETAWLKRERVRATRFAWNLPSNPVQRPLSGRQSATNGLKFPIWDETLLLAAHAQPTLWNKRMVSWQSATLDFENGKWSAFLVGQNVSATVWNERRNADKSRSLAVQRLDLETATAPFSTAPKTATAPPELFFGFPSGSLFAERGGISLRSPLMKWAWTWRERDLFLPDDASTAPHLLTFRGAEERAQVLAPWATATGEPHLRFEAQKPVWSLDLNAATPHFPGAMRALSGPLSGFNAALSPLQMRLDAQSGAVRFAALRPDSSRGAWRKAYPEIATDNGGERRAADMVLLSAQAELLAALEERETTFYRPSPALNAENAATLQILGVEKSAFSILQSGLPSPHWERNNADLAERITALDAALLQGGAGEANSALRRGEPVVWRDARAPGGFWLGRAVFSVISGGGIASSSPLLAPHGLVLKRVALTGVAPNSRIGVGDSLRVAVLNFRGENPAPARLPRALQAAPLNSKALSGGAASPALGIAALETAALETHRAIQDAVQRGAWKRYGVLSKRQNAILERIVALRQQKTKSP